MGKLTISMAIFNSYVKLPEGTNTWHFQIDALIDLPTSEDESFQGGHPCHMSHTSFICMATLL